MPVTITCPNPDCGKKFRIHDKAIGKRVKCSRCGKSFTVSRPESQPQTVPQGRSRQTPDKKCPSCGCDLAANTVLCVQCGFDLRTGKKHQCEDPEPSTTSLVTRPRLVFFGLAGAASSVIVALLLIIFLPTNGEKKEKKPLAKQPSKPLVSPPGASQSAPRARPTAKEPSKKLVSPSSGNPSNDVVFAFINSVEKGGTHWNSKDMLTMNGKQITNIGAYTISPAEDKVLTVGQPSKITIKYALYPSFPPPLRAFYRGEYLLPSGSSDFGGEVKLDNSPGIHTVEIDIPKQQLEGRQKLALFLSKDVNGSYSLSNILILHAEDRWPDSQLASKDAPGRAPTAAIDPEKMDDVKMQDPLADWRGDYDKFYLAYQQILENKQRPEEQLVGKEIGLVSRICGWIRVRVSAQVDDTRRFRCLRTCGNRMLFSWSVLLCCSNPR